MKTVYRTYKFRMYPSAGQRQVLARYFGSVRFIYNHYLAERKRQYKETGRSDWREIEVNHQANAFKKEVKALLWSEKGLKHRSNRPIEPEAVFGDIKFNYGFKHFRLKSNRKVKVEFGLVATAHNIRKLIAVRGAAKLMGMAMPTTCGAAHIHKKKETGQKFLFGRPLSQMS